MADKTVIILRNDPARNRKRLGKVKDLYENELDDLLMYDFELAFGKIKKEMK